MMKKYILFGLVITFSLISWGFIGHETVATIAEKHLTANARGAIKVLLGDQTIADVASWADQVRNQPEYQQTGPLHYVNVEPGLSYEQFATVIRKQGANNLYGALLKYETDLTSNTTNHQQKAEALKFIVHFIGDAHQPMHVSRAEDQGGNTIQLLFEDKPTNLHSLWDSGLINRQGLNYKQMAETYDTATPVEIKQWQNDPEMKWLWESYQISNKLYAEVGNNSSLGEPYYKEHIQIVQQRVEMAGIRLAGVLNKLLASYTPPVNDDVEMAGEVVHKVTPKEVAHHIGDNISTVARLYNGRVIESSGVTLLDFGGEDPTQDFVVVINPTDKSRFGRPEVELKGKMVNIIGKVISYKGKPEILATETMQIQVAGKQEN